ncbi:hypothetical protein H0O02_01930, partial [Candidatus Micrarchaeota archaeon]|nr:hypothetical protein [Candidatus Micrarchaeota archaeon]
MNGKTLYLGGMFLMLVLASGIVSAAVTELTGFVNIEKSAEKPNVLEIGVLTATPAVQSGGGSASEVYEEVRAACAGSADQTTCLVKEFEARNVNPATAIGLGSIENAEFMVTYYNPATGSSTAVPGCEEVIADQSREISYYGTPVQYYYGTCTVDETLYAGIRINVKATLVGGIPEGVSVNAPPQSVELSGIAAAPGDIFSTMLANALAGLSSDTTTLPCLGVFLILGLLLASMYFSGKSPVTMLDITTPRLPMPKGLTAGGQVMLPYGYGEMKGALNKKMIASAGAAAASANALKGKLGHDAEMDKMDRQIDDFIKTSKFKGAALGEGKQAENMMKSLATAGRATGKTAEEIKAVLGKLPYHYGDAEHKTIAEILNGLNGMGEREKLMAASMKDYMLSMRTLGTLDKISGHPSMGRSVMHHNVEKTLGSMMGRYTLIGGTLGAGAAGSWKRSVEVVGRGTKEMVMQAPTLARGVARTTMTMVGGERAVEDLGKTKPGVAAWLKKPAKSVDIGQMMPVNAKMDHLYNVIKEEAVKDEAKYILKQFYKSLGVNMAITEEELVKMGYKDMDILEASGYNKNAAKIKQLEPELIAILASRELDAVQKRDMLMEFAKSHGAIIDQGMLQFNEKLAAIEASADPGYMKFLKLQEMLVQHERSTQAAAEGQVMAGDKFYTVVGRSSIAGSDLMDTMVFRSLIRDAEKGELIQGGLKEELQMAWLKTVNRMVSLRPTSNMEELPEFMRDHAELSKIEKRVSSTLGDILTEEGRASLKRFTGKDISNATIEDHVKVLYGGKSMAPKDYEEIGKTGKVAYWGDAREMGALRGNYKIYSDELWVDKLDSRTPIPIAAWTRSIFYRSYIEPHDATVEAKLNRTPGSAHWSP